MVDENGIETYDDSGGFSNTRKGFAVVVTLVQYILLL